MKRDFTKADITIKNSSGAVIKIIPVKSWQVSIKVKLNEFGSGIFFYDLNTDGTTVLTGKKLLTK